MSSIRTQALSQGVGRGERKIVNTNYETIPFLNIELYSDYAISYCSNSCIGHFTLSSLLYTVSFNVVCACDKGTASQCYRYRASEGFQAFCVQVQCCSCSCFRTYIQAYLDSWNSDVFLQQQHQQYSICVHAVLTMDIMGILSSICRSDCCPGNLSIQWNSSGKQGNLWELWWIYFLVLNNLEWLFDQFRYTFLSVKLSMHSKTILSPPHA